jgi:hypothetical protein
MVSMMKKPPFFSCLSGKSLREPDFFPGAPRVHAHPLTLNQSGQKLRTISSDILFIEPDVSALFNS